MKSQDSDMDESDDLNNLDSIFPSISENFDDEIDYNNIMSRVEELVKDDPDAENIFMGLHVLDLKRREVMEEFDLNEHQYNNGVRRLDTIKNNVVNEFSLKQNIK